MSETNAASAAGFPRTSRQRGFTIIEVTVSLIVTVIVLLGVLALFDFSNKLTRVQTNISDMQQSMRVAQTDSVRLIRMAGRGGLPVGNLPDGFAISVRNNVGKKVGDTLTIGDAGTPEVVHGSDVLTVRGVFSTPIYQLNSAGGTASFSLSPAVGTPTSGTLHINSTTPTGIPQDLTAITDAIKKNRPEALILVSAQGSDTWAVVELDPGNSDASNPADIKVGFKISANSYSKFSSAGAGVYPATLTSAAFVGILEEYRFYVRRTFEIAGNDKSEMSPKLSRARAYPGTQLPWDGKDDNWQVDIADNIFDLQVALGLDTAAKDPAAGACAAGTIASDDVNCGIYESADGEGDDWMYNGEKTTDPALFANSDLYYIRISTLARTDRPDPNYTAPTLVRVEDNVYDTDDGQKLNTLNIGTTPLDGTYGLMFRRRILRTVIDMRNLG
ncbi:MAG TPA: prepilin-type N-terminal cleavage/methylation domain-containing protein [Thermoanaerobaculia bacterium]|jgi:type II secretory pathway pseudopilin PulG